MSPMGEPLSADDQHDPRFVDRQSYEAAFGESLAQTLDPDTWRTGQDLDELYARVRSELGAALEQERRTLPAIREHVFPRLRSRHHAPREAGVHTARLADVECIHRGLLFNGGVAACDATQAVHDTLPLTVFQFGVSLVAYDGNHGTWSHRLFRRDLRLTGVDPVEEAVTLLERRATRSGEERVSRRDALSALAREAIMSYAERAILLTRATAVWRLGHGSPAPYELITGSGSPDLMVRATKLIETLVCDQQRFVFVPSAPAKRELLTIGQALEPLEYAIVDRYSEHVWRTIEHGDYRMRTTEDTRVAGRRLTPEEWIRRFRDQVADRVVVGVYRASRIAPPRLFYAHEDYAHLAAQIALADSLLQEHRGFPMLIDLADRLCAASFGESLTGAVREAYAEAGVPLRYEAERRTRYR